MAANKKSGLGKGLEALFGDIEINAEEIKSIDSSSKKETAEKGDKKIKDGVYMIDINNITPNVDQPRKVFDEDKLNELADSIKEHGVIQPLVLRPLEKEGYEIIAGERRWRAARRAGLKKIPCIIKELSDEQNMLVAIIENMQRENLNPIEEAEGLNKMIDTFGLTQEQVAKSVGKSRPYVTNSLRLLNLAEELRGMVLDGSLSAGHARALLAVIDTDKQKLLAEKTKKEDLSVRALEKLIKGKAVRRKPRTRVSYKGTDIIQVESELKDLLGTKVKLNHKGKSGKIEIDYYSREELDRLIELLRSLE